MQKARPKKERDLSDYETVKERKERFYKDNPNGRIIVDAIRVDDREAHFKATVYVSPEDQDADLPKSTGYAQEFKGQGGFANNHAWCENCEESAVGRALDNAGYCGSGKCSREEMEKVKRAEEAATKAETEQLTSARKRACAKLQKMTSDMSEDDTYKFLKSNFGIASFDEVFNLDLTQLMDMSKVVKGLEES